MLHYSNASSREKNRRYLVIKGGSLPGCSGRKDGSSTPQSYWVAAASVSVSSERRGGRNNEYNANICISMHDMTMSVARCALTQQEVIPAKGENNRENIPGVLRFRTNESEGKVVCSLRQGRVTDERAAYPDSSCCSEQLSCRKHFHPRYSFILYDFSKI